jgi:hypothetical protein
MEQAGEMAGQPGMGGQMKMAAGQMRVLMGVAEDVKSCEFNVSVSKQGVLLGMLLAAKPDSGLAGLFNEPSVSSADMLGFVPATGAIVGYYSGDETGKAGEYIGAKLDAALIGEDTTEEQRQALKDMMMRSMQMNRGGAFDLFLPGGSGLSGLVVSKVSDEKAYLDLMRSMPGLMEKSGLKAMYDEAGMTMTIELQENVRSHNGVSIHKYIQQMDMPQTAEMPPQMAAVMSMFTNIQYEIAVVNNYSITDMGTQKMDEIIDAIKANKPISKVKLAAEQKYPANGDLYVDIHIPRIGIYVVGMVQAMMGPMGEQMGPQMAKVTEALVAMNVEPITAFVGTGQGNLQGQLNVPMDPIVKVKDTVMQAMQPPAPEPVAP